MIKRNMDAALANRNKKKTRMFLFLLNQAWRSILAIKQSLTCSVKKLY